MTRGPRIVTEQTRAEMRKILEEIQSGSFAREWLAEHRGGGKNFARMRQADANHQVEVVGRQLRAMMPWSEEGKARAAGQEVPRSEFRVPSESGTKPASVG
jgi:ketol-acid reductoisomerase